MGKHRTLLGQVDLLRKVVQSTGQDRDSVLARIRAVNVVSRDTGLGSVLEKEPQRHSLV